ncbi:MAG: dihydroorotase [Ignavibacteriae bacterium]|nr:dihydroorotase [Ignavibacteriota bacterium]MCB9243216.1 dihydroorotase [Ignavibacteriales bacterium]
MKLLIKNIKIVSPADRLNRTADIYIENGIIKEIGKVDKEGVEVINGKGLTCVPGLFDMHVHFREPGQTHKEDIKSGSESAMNGGFTGVTMMPNTSPAIDTPKVIKQVLKHGKNSLIDLTTTACITKNRAGHELANINSSHKAGAVAFTDDGSPVANPMLVRKSMEEISKIDSLFVQHAEDMILSDHGAMNEGKVSKKLGIKGIPTISETVVVARDLEIARFVKGTRYHLQHASCGDSIDIILNARADGVNATVEACPHHFILTDKACETYGTNAKMNPPLRTQKDVDRILKAFKEGQIDVICTDHAPHAESEKKRPFAKAPFGIIGLETSVALSYTFLVDKKIISFEEMIRKMSINPRKILKLSEIRIKKGQKANLTILDTNAKWVIDKSKFKTKSRNTPFDGWKVKCKPFAVINNDKVYYSDL